jgi:hypothetical protein
MPFQLPIILIHVGLLAVRLMQATLQLLKNYYRPLALL